MIKRNFYPGDSWLYFKVYTSPQNANDLLINKILPLIIKWQKQDVINKWFFIRYLDPKYHLRIRFDITDLKFLGNLISDMRIQLNEELKTGIVETIQIDTYKRELERYGVDNIEKCELFFHKDSLDVLDLLSKGLKEMELIKETVSWIYRLLISLNYTLAEILVFAHRMDESFKNEFDFSVRQIQFFNNIYRSVRSSIIMSLHDNSEQKKQFINFLIYG